MKKSLVYFDDAERDLTIRMYSELKKAFEVLRQEDWEAQQGYFLKDL